MNSATKLEHPATFTPGYWLVNEVSSTSSYEIRVDYSYFWVVAGSCME